MKKIDYLYPEMKVIDLELKTTILAGSGEGDTVPSKEGDGSGDGEISL